MLERLLMRAISILTLIAPIAVACSSPEEPALLVEADWTYEASGTVSGVSLRPNGDVVLAVGAGDAPFQDGGGAVVFSPDGLVRSEIAMVLDPPCESCTRLIFQPNAPLNSSGGDILFGDYQSNAFRLAADDSLEWFPITNPRDVSLGLFGIDASSTASADGERIFLAGSSLAVLDEGGAILEAIDFGEVVRQIVPLGGTDYLVNITGAFDEVGTLVHWNASSDERMSIQFGAPVVAIASKEGWTIAAMELGVGQYRLAELDLAQAPPTVNELTEFELPTGKISLALRARERQVVAGSSGIRAAHDGTAAILVGSALLLDADEGAMFGADVASVRGLAISADDSMVYVADTGGLHAYALPEP